MAGDFIELQKMLEEQKARNSILRDDLEALNSHLFNPQIVKFKTDMHTELPKSFYNSDAISTHEDEISRKADLVRICIEQLQTATTLIEAQIALDQKIKVRPSDIESCVDFDKRAFRIIFERAIAYDDEISKSTFIRHIEDATKLALGNISVYFAKVEAGIVPKKFQSMEPQLLLEKIYQTRMDFAESAIGYSHLKIERQKMDFEDAAHLKTALRLDLISKKHVANLEKLADQKMKLAFDALPDSYAEVLAIHRFLSSVYEMGDDDYGRKPFRPTRYEPVSINALAKFAP